MFLVYQAAYNVKPCYFAGSFRCGCDINAVIDLPTLNSTPNRQTHRPTDSIWLIKMLQNARDLRQWSLKPDGRKGLRDSGLPLYQIENAGFHFPASSRCILCYPLQSTILRGVRPKADATKGFTCAPTR